MVPPPISFPRHIAGSPLNSSPSQIASVCEEFPVFRTELAVCSNRPLHGHSQRIFGVMWNFFFRKLNVLHIRALKEHLNLGNKTGKCVCIKRVRLKTTPLPF
jgi:hypothetical protein